MVKRLMILTTIVLAAAALVWPLSTGQAAPGAITPTTARIRFINGAPDVGAVNFLVDGVAPTGCTGCAGLDFPGTITPTGKARGYTSYFALPAGAHTISVTSSTGSAVGSPLAVTLVAGSDYTLALSGNAANPPYALVQFTDHNTAPPVGMVSIRFINLVPASGTLALTMNPAPAGVTLPSAAYQAASGYFNAPVGSAVFGFTNGSSITFTSSRTELLEGTRVYTIFALGSSTSNFQALQATDSSSLRKIFLPLVFNNFTAP